MQDPPYLDHPSFREKHTGPHLTGAHDCVLKQRDPSPEQIAAMVDAILRSSPRDEPADFDDE